VSFWSIVIVTDDSAPWPAYDVGPHESIFALGVASANYARLEVAFAFLFAKVFGITNDQAWERLAKTDNPTRIRLIRGQLKGLAWPDETKDRVAHFVEAFEILVHNRNHLDHSAFMELPNATVLYKYDPRDGKKTQLVELTLLELRQIADDMRMYYDYGLYMGNFINSAGGLNTSVSQPPLPKRLFYRSR
jgi:hypothetical protein